MNLKEYNHQPDEGLFEKIEQRMRRRRIMRRSAMVAAIAAVGMLVWALSGERKVESGKWKAQSGEVAAVSSLQPEEMPFVAYARTEKADERVAVVEQKAEKQPQSADIVVASSKANNDETAPEVGAPAKEESGMPREAVVVPGATRVAAVPAAVDAVPADVAATDEIDGSQIAVETPERQMSPSPNSSTDNESLIWVPNIILPNGDRDENRTFRIKKKGNISEFEIRIFNRRGMQLFSSNDPAFVWNATYGGQQVPQGAYVWVIGYRDDTGKPHTEKGTITVVR